MLAIRIIYKNLDFKLNRIDTRTMQPSIKMFFKAKETPNQSPGKNSVKTNLEDEKELKTTPKKRSAEDEGDTKDNKRLAISPLSQSKTAIKGDNELSECDKPSTTNNSTPTMKNKSAESKPFAQSPLMNMTSLIRIKISSGAYALHENIGLSWFKALQGEFDKPYFKKLSAFVQEERNSKTVYPPPDKVFSWTHHHDIKDTRVVIIGQDPYHGPNQAHGLSFSVQDGIALPPSLVNIFKEVENDIPGFKTPKSGNLTGWAKQGVLMLNTCLTVNRGQAYSHQNKGWETFTDAVITWISKNAQQKVVFLLWGRPAQKKSSMIDKRHKVLTAAHPSPLSAYNGFFGCSHFLQTNTFRKSLGLPEIDWKAL